METLKAIASRKSIRSYTGEQISEDQLEKILFAGSVAPVGGGAKNCIHLTVVQNQELLRKISTLTAKAIHLAEGADPLYNAPTLIIASGKIGSPFNDEVPNCACIVENMSIEATDLGLGSVYLGSFLNAIRIAPELNSELGIPDGFAAFAGLAVGYTNIDLSMEKEFKLTENLNYIR